MNAIRKFLSVVIFICCAAVTCAQTNLDSNAITKPDNLPLFPVALQVDPRFASAFPGEQPPILNLPAGFSVNVFAANITGARFMCWSPDSVLYVCAMGAGKVIALPDTDHNGICDATITVASGLNTAHSLEFYRDTLYVAETSDVLKMVDTNGDRVIDVRNTLISGILTGHHNTRTLLFDEQAHKLYVSVGSSANIAVDPPERACILQFNDDGTGKRVFAGGLRNSVGLAFHPVTHELWANNNGFDDAGNDIPPEVVNIIHDGGFYGWPYAYGDKRFNPIFTAETGLPMTHDDSVLVWNMTPPVVQVQAHSAPLGLHFYTSHELPSEYFNSALMCYHGSWNRSPATGEKVVRVRGNADGTNMVVADFMTGFLTDSIKTVRWGRPVGVISDHRGNIYISDDFAHAIYRVHYTAPSDVHGDRIAPQETFIDRVHPNPATGSCALEIVSNAEQSVGVMIADTKGAIVQSLQDQRLHVGRNELLVGTNDLPAGAYRVCIEHLAGSVPLQIIK